MEKMKVLYGFFIGIILTFVGVVLFLNFVTEYDFVEGIDMMRSTKSLGKLISLGCVLNLCAFFLLLKINQELMARGLVLATILVGIITIFV